MCFMGAFKYLFKKRALPRKKIWSAGFGISKIKSAGFGYKKMHFGMQASGPFFGSLQALAHPPRVPPIICIIGRPCSLDYSVIAYCTVKREHLCIILVEEISCLFVIVSLE